MTDYENALNMTLRSNLARKIYDTFIMPDLLANESVSDCQGPVLGVLVVSVVCVCIGCACSVYSGCGCSVCSGCSGCACSVYSGYGCSVCSGCGSQLPVVGVLVVSIVGVVVLPVVGVVLKCL